MPDPLADLHGYHLPEPVSWWPPAPGWWLLALLVLAALAGLVWWLLRRRRRRAAARQALAELQRLRAGCNGAGDAVVLARGLSRLLRRYALARFPRGQVAGLTGEAWLRFLDARCDGQPFQAGPGRLLLDAPYRPRADLPGAAALADLVEQWIRRNAEVRS